MTDPEVQDMINEDVYELPQTYGNGFIVGQTIGRREGYDAGWNAALERVKDSSTRIEEAAKAIWSKRPDCAGKPWPLETAEQKRAYPHNPIAAVDLCFIYAKAALDA